MASQEIYDDLDQLMRCLPPRVADSLRTRDDLNNLLEIILDLSRPPEARFPDGDYVLDNNKVSEHDINYVISRIGQFGDDNRSGIERTLHRISAIRNRQGKILGITCRVGRAVYGTIKTIEDLVFSGNNILLLGRPGVGKTTMLREVGRVLADTAKKRVIIVDTSNEIAGDGDIPHPAIGHARRMQVASSHLQHSVMIEAVENHMPEVIIIDEMGTELEAVAARTIAERGVQLIATAHGNTLDNLIVNPTLSDLVGGVQTVILGDDEARFRGTQKTVLERKAPPTFDVVVEIQTWDVVAVHDNVAQVVDSWLRGYPITPETRRIDSDGCISKEVAATCIDSRSSSETPNTKNIHRSSIKQSLDKQESTRIFLFGVDRNKFQEASNCSEAKVEVVNDLRDANIILTTKSHYRKGSRVVHIADKARIPLYVIRKNSLAQVKQFLTGRGKPHDSHDTSMDDALKETHEAAQRVLNGEDHIDLASQRAYVRRLQHLLAEKYNVISLSSGVDPDRHVRLLKK